MFIDIDKETLLLNTKIKEIENISEIEQIIAYLKTTDKKLNGKNHLSPNR